jgi:hypothetical protein
VLWPRLGDRQAEIEGTLEPFLGLGGPPLFASHSRGEKPRPSPRRVFLDQDRQAILGLVESSGRDRPFGEQEVEPILDRLPELQGNDERDRQGCRPDEPKSSASPSAVRLDPCPHFPTLPGRDFPGKLMAGILADGRFPAHPGSIRRMVGLKLHRIVRRASPRYDTALLLASRLL